MVSYRTMQCKRCGLESWYSFTFDLFVDIYGKIIILCRILNAIILWSICALPFTQLSALLLISIMTGSLVLQALVDLLD